MFGGRKIRSNKGTKRGPYKPRKHTKISVSPGGTRRVYHRKIRSNKGKKRNPYGPRTGKTRSGKRFRNIRVHQSGGSGSGSGSGSSSVRDPTLPNILDKATVIKYQRHEFGSGNDSKSFKYRPVVQDYRSESLGITFSSQLSSDKKPIVETVISGSLADQYGVRPSDKLLGIFSGGVDNNLHCQTCGIDSCGEEDGGPVTCFDSDFGSGGCLVGVPKGSVNVDKIKQKAIKIDAPLDKNKICWAFQPKDCDGNDCEGGGAGGTGATAGTGTTGR